MVMNSRRFLPSMHPHETQAESADTSPGTPGPQFALIVQNLSGLQGPWAFLLVLSWDGADLGLQREGTAQGSVPRVAWDKQKMQLGLHQHWVEITSQTGFPERRLLSVLTAPEPAQQDRGQ